MTKLKEQIIEKSLMLSATFTVLTTVAIIGILLYESIQFFSNVSLLDFLTDTQWTPLFTEKHFGILPLLSGTFITSLVALLIAVPMGLSIAIYLNEYADTKFREAIKPLLELLAAVPSVVYGFFALIIVTPILQSFFPSISGFNSLSAGIVMAIMILPFISSLSEDALSAVPKALREASYAMGATRFQTVFKVTVPAANSGIVVSVILAVSRAVGETMIVAIAAGQQPRLSVDPTVPIQTVSAYIVQVSMGDVPHESIEYRTIFVAGITLFLLTFILNNLSYNLRKKYQRKYE
jgi:phosphate transport system permease protein